jgi:hypothetical protein
MQPSLESAANSNEWRTPVPKNLAAMLATVVAFGVTGKIAREAILLAAPECARSRRHPLQQLLGTIQRMVNAYDRR